jgi:hypothetical protein
MSHPDTTEPSHEEIAWELAELFEGLSIETVNEMLAKNVPMETLQFIADYASDFADAHSVDEPTRRGIPNLLLLGYLLRIVEDRLLGDDAPE